MAKTPQKSPFVVVPGNLDGVHRGHQALIEQAKKRAHELDAAVAVLSFDPHPAQFFAPASAPTPLTTLKRKTELLQSYGVGTLHVERFDKAFSQLEPEAFVESVLVDQLAMRAIVLGEDFHFGKNRLGNVDTLKKLALRYNFDVHPIAAIELLGARISSTRIREALRQQDIQQANILLGHAYDLVGKVAKGDQRGRQLGFPTANLTEIETLVPGDGVYLVKARLADNSINRSFDGVCSIGIRPTFKTDPSFEVHLFDFDHDIYDQHLRIAFLEFLRAEERFGSMEALKKQIAQDCEQARDMLRSLDIDALDVFRGVAHP